MNISAKFAVCIQPDCKLQKRVMKSQVKIQRHQTNCCQIKFIQYEVENKFAHILIGDCDESIQLTTLDFDQEIIHMDKLLLKLMFFAKSMNLSNDFQQISDMLIDKFVRSGNEFDSIQKEGLLRNCYIIGMILTNHIQYVAKKPKTLTLNLTDIPNRLFLISFLHLTRYSWISVIISSEQIQLLMIIEPELQSSATDLRIQNEINQQQLNFLKTFSQLKSLHIVLDLCTSETLRPLNNLLLLQTLTLEIVEDIEINIEYVQQIKQLILYEKYRSSVKLPQIGKMKNLKIFQIESNNDKFLSTKLGITNLVDLVQLELRFSSISVNNLLELENKITDFRNLRILQLSFRDSQQRIFLHHYPRNVHRFQNLQVLKLDAIVKQGQSLLNQVQLGEMLRTLELKLVFLLNQEEVENISDEFKVFFQNVIKLQSLCKITMTLSNTPYPVFRLIGILMQSVNQQILIQDNVAGAKFKVGKIEKGNEKFQGFV